jgi:hypothetical protein
VVKCCRVGEVTDDNIIRRTHFACWIPKATNTHSEYVILFACPLHHSLHERASVVPYTYIAYLDIGLIQAVKVCMHQTGFDVGLVVPVTCQNLTLNF